MSKSIQVEKEKDFFARMRNLAKKLDHNEFVGSYENVSFEDAGEMEAFLIADEQEPDTVRTFPVIRLATKKHDFFSASFVTQHVPIRGKVAAKKAERLVASSKGAFRLTRDEKGKIVSGRLITDKSRKDKTRA